MATVQRKYAERRTLKATHENVFGIFRNPGYNTYRFVSIGRRIGGEGVEQTLPTSLGFVGLCGSI